MATAGRFDGAGDFQGPVFPPRFEVRRVIGRGGAGSVFEAWDRRLHRTVALKVLRAGAEAADVTRHEEARVLASLAHPNLVTVFDTFVAPDGRGVPTAILVLELVDGPDLHQLLRTATLSTAQVAQVGAQLCSALSYVHERGFLHQDLKPSNVLLTFREQEVTAKLSDFGTAVLLSGADDQGEFTIGTAAYLSPEQAAGTQLTAASDVYALGLVLLEAATGEVAFPGSVLEAALARLDVDPVVPEELPAELRDVLLGMTRRDARSRMGLREVRTRLERLIAPAAAPPISSGSTERAASLPAAITTGGASTAQFFRPQEAELTRLLELAVLLFDGDGAAVLERLDGRWQHRVAIDLPELATIGLRTALTARAATGTSVHDEDGQRLLVSAVPHDPERCLVVRLQRDARITASTTPRLEALAEILAAALQLRDALRRALYAR